MFCGLLILLEGIIWGRFIKCQIRYGLHLSVLLVDLFNKTLVAAKGQSEWLWPKSGLWMVTVQFVFGSLLVAELRSEPKVKTHGEGQQDQRTTTHGREKEKGNENLCEELDWINRVCDRLHPIIL